MLTHHRRVGALAIVCLVVWATIAQAGLVLGHGFTTSTYRARVVPDAAAAGTTTTFDVQLRLTPGNRHDDDTDQPHPRRLRSVRILAPSGFTFLDATASNRFGPVATQVSDDAVTVNDLRLRRRGQTALVSIEASIDCGVSGPATWTTIGHNTRTFTNPLAGTLRLNRNSLLTTSVGSCSLDFLNGPADAEAGANITRVARDPGAAAVRVRLLDGDGDPAAIGGVPVGLAIAPGTGASGADLDGDTTEPTSASGIASFSTLSIDLPGLAYRLVASGTGLGPDTSGPFDIHGVLVPCSGECSASVTMGDTTASVSTTGDGFIWVSLGVDELSCDDEANHHYPQTSEVLTWGVVGVTEAKIITIIVDKDSVDEDSIDAASDTDNGTPTHRRFQVCFSSPTTGFVNRFGEQIDAGEAGLLPDCFHHHHHDLAGTTAAGVEHDNDDDPVPPCVLRRGRTWGGNFFVRFLVDEADPKGHI